MLNLEHLRIFIKDILDEYFKDDKQEYKEFTDVKQFCEISGISKNDFENKVVENPHFRDCVYRFDDSAKRYIHTRTGLKALMKIFKDVS